MVERVKQFINHPELQHHSMEIDYQQGSLVGKEPLEKILISGSLNVKSINDAEKAMKRLTEIVKDTLKSKEEDIQFGVPSGSVLDYTLSCYFKDNDDVSDALKTLRKDRYTTYETHIVDVDRE